MRRLRPVHAGITGIAALVAVSLGLTALQSTSAQSPPPPTYTKDIAPILFEHCAGCHNPSGPAPFSVLNSDAVRAHGRDIAAMTASRMMPPWLPEPGYGEFAGNRRLTTTQIDTIRAWVQQGMPEGNRANLPTTPAPDGWQLGEPDLIVTMPVPYTLPAGDTDVFRNFVIPIPVAETRFVKTIEVRPGSARFVHHALVAIDETPSSRKLDDQDPGPGFAGMDLMGEAHMPDGSLLGWTPGMLPFPGIAGMTWRLQPRTDLVLQLHMLPSDTPHTVQASVGLHFGGPSDVPDPAHVLLLDADDQLNIPVGEKNFVVNDSMTLPVDVDVLLVYPHAHYLGKSIDAWATLPDGTTEWLIKINHWDFMWQDMYRYAKPVPLPKGTTINMRWTFDNSAENPNQRYHPPRPITSGNRSTNEMAHLQLQMRLHRPDDRPVLQEAQYAHVVQRNPRNARLRYGLASALKEQGRYDEAAREYRAALAIDPDYFAAHLNLGATLMMQAIPARLGVDAAQRAPWPQADEAIAHLRAAVTLDPDSAGAHYNLGIAFVYQGQLGDAAREYAEAIRSNPAYAEAHNNLGQVLIAQGELDAAIEHLRAAERLMPTSADAPNNLGIALFRQGKTEDAISAFRRALQIDAGHQGARQNLDIALKAAGQRP